MIEPEEIRALSQRLKDTGVKMRGVNIYQAVMPESGLAFRIYTTEERNFKLRSTVIQDEDQTWALVAKGCDEIYWQTQGDLVLERIENITFEIRGDEDQFLRAMSLCRLFDELLPDDEVRMSS